MTHTRVVKVDFVKELSVLSEHHTDIEFKLLAKENCGCSSSRIQRIPAFRFISGLPLLPLRGLPLLVSWFYLISGLPLSLMVAEHALDVKVNIADVRWVVNRASRTRWYQNAVNRWTSKSPC